MITPFGKELRKARVDLDMAQVDMAKTIGVSPAYLSAVETGRRKATYALCERIGRLTKDKALEIKLKNLVSLESGMVPIHEYEALHSNTRQV